MDIPLAFKVRKIYEQSLMLSNELTHIVYLKNDLLAALIEGFEEFMEFYIPYTLHTRPEILEEMLTMYRRKVENFRQMLV